VMVERIDRLRFLAGVEPTTAAMVLNDVFRDLLDYWFKMRGEFTPSPKEFKSIFESRSPAIADLIRAFTVDKPDLPSRLDTATQLIAEVFGASTQG